MELEFYVLDVTYEVVGGEPHIIIWAITRSGERVVLRDRGFRPYFYAILEDNTSPQSILSKIKTLGEASSPILSVEPVDKRFLGKPVKALKVVTLIPEYVRKYRERIKQIPGIVDVVEADIRFSMRYILDKSLRPCGWHTAKVSELKSTQNFRVQREYEVVGSIESLEDSMPPKDLKGNGY
jgi:DNA polymerase I